MDRSLSITARTIDHDKARGLEMEGSHHARIPSGWRVLIRYRLLLVFAAAALFHFANAPNAAFLTLAMVATAGLLLIVIAMPETTPSPKGGRS